MLSCAGLGGGSFGRAVGVAVLSGRKIVKNALPAKSPTNADRGPSGGGIAGGAGKVWSGRSSPKKKPSGS